MSGQANPFETVDQLDNLPDDFPPLPPPVTAHLADPNLTGGRYISPSQIQDDTFESDIKNAMGEAGNSGDGHRSRSASPLRTSRSASPYRSATSSPLKKSHTDSALTLEASPLKFSLDNQSGAASGSLEEGPYSPIMEPWQVSPNDLDEPPNIELVPRSSSNPLQSEPKEFSTQAINDTYHEIPIPRELKLPPLLSSRRRANNTPSMDNLSGRRRRSSANSGSILNMTSPGTPNFHNRRGSRGSTPVLLGREDSPKSQNSGNSTHFTSPGSGFGLDFRSPRRRRQSSNFGLKSSRPKSVLMDELPPPEWDPSPLMSELPVKRAASNSSALASPAPFGTADPFAAVGDGGASDGYDSDDGASFRSDVATIRSELSDFEYGDNYDSNAQGRNSDRKSKMRPKSWISSAWQGFTKKKGERLNDGDEDDGDRFDSIKDLGSNTTNDEDDFENHELGFTRFDKGLVGHHMQSVLDGSVKNTGGPVTSLIEELEIRKADRRAKKEVIARDALKLQDEVKAYNKTAHPMDHAPQPTLLELQQLAEFEYLERKNWHANALSRREFERTHETLAQRRSRVQGLKQQIDRVAAGPSVVQEQTAKFGAHETLMDRKRRLAGKKAQRSLRSQPSWTDTESISDISSLPPPQHVNHRPLRAEISMDSTLRAVVMGYNP